MIVVRQGGNGKRSESNISSSVHIEKNGLYYDADNTVDGTDGHHRK
jgi:hypothetical protein